MNLSGWRLLLFAIVGLITIAVLTFQGTRKDELDSLDRHTGLSPDELIEIARRSGSAVAAYEFLVEHEDRFVDYAPGRATIAILAAELVEDKEFVKKANAVILARSRCRRMGNWRDDWNAPLLTDRFKRRF